MKINQIRSELGTTQLIAVSKYQTIDAIKILYDEGQRDFGESRAQELAEKYAALPKDINWHFIGHLQTNKVRQVLPFLTCIQSVDSEKLLYEVARESQRIGKKIDVLLQLKVAQEETKYGFSAEDLHFLIKNIQKMQNNANNNENVEKILFENVVFCGIMGMASNTDDEMQIKREFKALKSLFEQLKADFFKEDENFAHLSMGMSGDYKLAVAAGSTMVRIGSLLFEQ